jgi:hypothetical protein
MSGYVNVIQEINTIYYLDFFFGVEDSSVTNPLTTLGGIMNVNCQTNPSPMGVRQMQQGALDTANAFAMAANPHPPIPRTVGGGAAPTSLRGGHGHHFS